MDFKHESYFLEKRKPEIIEAFKSAYDKYTQSPTENFGIGKDLHKYVKGFNIAYYHHGDLLWEPIIFDIESGKVFIEYEKMSLNSKDLIEKYLKSKHNPYKVLETFCLVFHDGVDHHEFLFNAAKHYPIIKDYTRENVEILSSKLNEIFFIKPLVEQLDVDLIQKPEIKNKPKI